MSWLLSNWGVVLFGISGFVGFYLQYIIGRAMDRQSKRAANLILEKDETMLEIIDMAAEISPALTERAEARRQEIERLRPQLMRMAEGKSLSLREMYRSGNDERRDRRAMRKLKRQVRRSNGLEAS